ncbi:hypothetical protein LTS18_003797, partial [Coniosporium uncinatum]
MPKFVPRQRKHKARAREASANPATNNGDPNATEIVPASQAEKEERRRILREELRTQQPKVSGKKQKRLDKYIDKKLQKEENSELLKKLAQTKVDTSLFQSSKKLGRTNESKREALSRALIERQAGINVSEHNETLLENRITSSESDGDSDVEAPVIAPTPATQAAAPARTFGGGLKRPLEVDESGRPVIKKRQRTKGPEKPLPLPDVADEEESEWEGFRSETDGRSPQDGAGLSSGPEEEDDNDSEDGSGEEGGGDSVEQENARKARASAFKEWAHQQRNESVGFIPSTIPDTNGVTQTGKPIDFTPRQPEADPLPPELVIKTATDGARKAYSVQVERTIQIQEARMALPVVAEEQKIMEAIHNNDTVVIWGATGSGKTTQVPQFLFEAGYGDAAGPAPGLIGVTQPRRVAAVSMAKRVADELGDKKARVAHQIRFESSASVNTAIKFMTDGILIREIAQDFALTKYSAVVIDEAHERSVNTDILIGMLSRIVDLRAQMAKEDSKNTPLKLIIMSATLRISDFTQNERLFRKGPPPLVQAEGRQYPVITHFARTTHRDYVEEAFQKVRRGHKKLPPGAMLVFLTGQSEIHALAKKLKQAFPSTAGNEGSYNVRVSGAEAPLEDEDFDFDERRNDGNGEDSDDEPEIRGLDDDDGAEFEVEETAEDKVTAKTPKVHVLPLYSQLPTYQQLRVFEPPPEGSRLIVLATNVAETSLTIPGVRYVFDCGRVKEKQYDRRTGVQSFEVRWISKASASQRAGRAGRTGPGHCYRLYSSAVYERDFEEYTEPEILRAPIEGLVLQLKSMDLQHVVNFPFPTPPDRHALAKAEKLLTYLGAISLDGKITPTGKELSLYALSPRFARMLMLGQAHNLAAHTIALIAALEVPDLFIPQNQLDLHNPRPEFSNDDNDSDEDDDYETKQADIHISYARDQRRKAYNRAHHLLSRFSDSSDAIKLYAAVCAHAHAVDGNAFCEQHFVRQKAVEEASKLRMQLTEQLRRQKPGAVVGPYEPRLPAPTDKQIALLKQIVAAGFVDQVAIRADLAPSPSPPPPELPRKSRRAIDVPYLTLFPSHDARQTRTHQ